MVNSTLEPPIGAFGATAPREDSLDRCPICREFGSEECNVLQDLGRYIETAEATLKAAEREAARVSGKTRHP